MKNISKYEYARIIGARALQLSLGAPPAVKIKNSSSGFIEIATKEFEDDALPLVVLQK